MMLTTIGHQSNRDSRRFSVISEMFSGSDVCPVCRANLYVVGIMKMPARLVLCVKLACEAGHYDASHNLDFPRGKEQGVF